MNSPRKINRTGNRIITTIFKIGKEEVTAEEFKARVQGRILVLGVNHEECFHYQYNAKNLDRAREAWECIRNLTTYNVTVTLIPVPY